MERSKAIVGISQLTINLMSCCDANKQPTNRQNNISISNANAKYRRTFHIALFIARQKLLAGHFRNEVQCDAAIQILYCDGMYCTAQWKIHNTMSFHCLKFYFVEYFVVMFLGSNVLASLMCTKHQPYI